MKLIVQGKQMRITEGMRRFAEEHVVRPLRRFYDDEAAELRVEVGRENGNRGESTECDRQRHMRKRLWSLCSSDGYQPSCL